MDHVVENCPAVGALSVLNASLFKQYEFIIKQNYKETSKRSNMCMEKITNRLKHQQDESESSFIAHIPTAENEAESGRKKRVLRNEAFSVRRG